MEKIKIKISKRSVLNSLPQKLLNRQMYGGAIKFKNLKPTCFFEKCPVRFQIPMQKIMDAESLKKGYVSIGFTSDGKYLISYQCEIRFQLDFDTGPVSYKYTLQWWLFHLWKPLEKVREAELFVNETIHQELHVLFCQLPEVNYIVVHGSTYSVDTFSSGKMSYVSVIPALNKHMSYAVHLRYELLPPHPPFITSVCLKLKNVILLNSGDMLFAILLNDERLFGTDEELPLQISENNIESSCCYCARLKNEKAAEPFNESLYNTTDTLNYNSNQTQKLSNFETGSSLIIGACSDYQDDESTVMSCDITNTTSSLDYEVSSPITNHNEDSSMSIATDCEEFSTKDEPCVDYISYVMQGYIKPIDNESQESLPASPFDCTATVMPCTVSSIDGTEVLNHAYEHRCFKSRNKGSRSGCDYFICQAQFDAENFVNEEIQLCDDICKQFVSVRDYDMQIVEVCPETNEVIILINALVVLRNKTSRSKDQSKSMREKSHKLVLYTLGFIISWNVYTGKVKVLKRYPLVEGPGTLCKTRQFSPSLFQTVQLRKKWIVPTSKISAVHLLSNHTVFTGHSVQYLCHPVLPVAIFK